jgi:hypothetical protein
MIIVVLGMSGMVVLRNGAIGILPVGGNMRQCGATDLPKHQFNLSEASYGSLFLFLVTIYWGKERPIMKLNKANIRKLVKEGFVRVNEEKLSSAQSKEMDKDKDGDIDGKDLSNLRKTESIYRIVKEEYAKIKGSRMMDEETKPHEADRHPPDTPADRIREETKPHEADRKPADTPEDRIRK